MSVRAKRPIEFYFNLILIFCFILFSILLLSCQPELNSSNTAKQGKLQDALEEQPCSNKATFKDFTGLDGCGLMLVLENGEVLNPVISDNKVPSTSDAFILNEAKDGMKVKISYTLIEGIMDVCMNGKHAQIDCITKV